ncbi:MAG TPA: hypothetical protein VL523_09595 [Terriglobia bacterium]|nr:hypothetical protein [Terriglobia bacterium]
MSTKWPTSGSDLTSNTVISSDIITGEGAPAAIRQGYAGGDDIHFDVVAIAPELNYGGLRIYGDGLSCSAVHNGVGVFKCV